MTATIVPPDTIEAEPARRTAQPIPTSRLVKVELRKMFGRDGAPVRSGRSRR